MSTTVTETIHKEIYVAATPETAFRVFTEEMAGWWPLGTHGLFQEEVETVTVERHVGGRIVERAKDGREAVWGEVLDYEVSSRFRCTWHPGWDADAEPTEVEVTFTAEGDGTLVTLEHRGWESLAEDYRRRQVGYVTGWDVVLEAYRAGV